MRAEKSLVVSGRSRSLTVMAVNEQLRLEPGPEPPRARADAALDAISVEAVARRVVELMRAGGGVPSARRLVDAGTLAAEFGVTRSWVYEHRDELGAVRIGAGPKPRLRFDLQAAREALPGHDGPRPLGQSPGSAGNAASVPAPLRRRPSSPLPPPGSVLAVRPRSGAS
jgi:hypothetical protein